MTNFFSKNALFKFFLIAIIPITTSCVSTTHRGQDNFDKAFEEGKYKQASDVYTDLLKQDEQEANANLAEDEKPVKLELEFFPSLNTATASFISGQSKKASKYFDRSGHLIKKEETDDYDPKYYEKIMLHTYNGFNSWRAKKYADARVYFNRAHQSQAQAIEDNKKKISELEEEVSEKKLDKSLSEAEKQIQELTPNLKDLKAYKNFANPYTSYLSGLFLVLNSKNSSDTENGINYLKRVHSMVPNNSYISSDIKMAENKAKGLNFEPTVWVFYEGGMAPLIDKLRISVPLYFGAGFKMATMALPKVSPSEMAYPEIFVKEDKDFHRTEVLANMDNIVEVELSERMPWEVAKALLWMSVNLIAQEGLQQSFRGDNAAIGLIAALVVSQIANPVETRIWSSLPKTMQIARFPLPANRTIGIYAPQNTKISETIKFKNNTRYAIIYVRASKIGSNPSILVSEF